jgi:uncharacterized protein (TIGR02246 family)
MNKDEQQIHQLISTWMSATKAGDTKTVLSLMSEDAIFLVTGQPPMIGRAAFAETSKENAKQSFQFDGHSEIQEIKVFGDWAYMWTKLSVTVTRPGAESMTRAGHTLSILRKEKGKWVLARDANMLAPVANK